MVIDSAMPSYDVVIAEHILVRTDPATTYRAARGLDLLRVHTPLLDAAMWVRQLPSRLTGRPAPHLPRLVIGEGVGIPGLAGTRRTRRSRRSPSAPSADSGWSGRSWPTSCAPRCARSSPTGGAASTQVLVAFPGFTEPGWGKIAANFWVRSCGANRTLLSYECRTGTTDPRSRRSFARYWSLIPAVRRAPFCPPRCARSRATRRPRPAPAEQPAIRLHKSPAAKDLRLCLAAGGAERQWRA